MQGIQFDFYSLLGAKDPVREKVREIEELIAKRKRITKLPLKVNNMLDIEKNSAILNGIGCGSPVSKAAACHRQGGKLLNKPFTVSFCEPVGRCVCTGVTLDTSSTPAGSFFVPDVEVRGKSHNENLIQRRSVYGCHSTHVPRGREKRLHGHPSINESGAHQGVALDQAAPQQKKHTSGGRACGSIRASGTYNHTSGGKLL